MVAPAIGAPVSLSTTKPVFSTPQAQAEAERSRRRERSEQGPARSDKLERPIIWPLHSRSIFGNLLHIDGALQQAGEGGATVVIADDIAGQSHDRLRRRDRPPVD